MFNFSRIIKDALDRSRISETQARTQESSRRQEDYRKCSQNKQDSFNLRILFWLPQFSPQKDLSTGFLVVLFTKIFKIFNFQILLYQFFRTLVNSSGEMIFMPSDYLIPSASEGTLLRISNFRISSLDYPDCKLQKILI